MSPKKDYPKDQLSSATRQRVLVRVVKAHLVDAQNSSSQLSNKSLSTQRRHIAHSPDDCSKDDVVPASSRSDSSSVSCREVGQSS